MCSSDLLIRVKETGLCKLAYFVHSVVIVAHMDISHDENTAPGSLSALTFLAD